VLIAVSAVEAVTLLSPGMGWARSPCARSAVGLGPSRADPQLPVTRM